MQQNFKLDFFELLNKLKKKEPFAFSKYADGEYAILRNEPITNCDGWTFDPKKHTEFRKDLLYSFGYKKEGYYIGISCPCCQPKEYVNWMRENVKVPKSRLTFANIFVNSNYELYKKFFIEEYKNHEVILVANKYATVDKLPFKIEKHVLLQADPFNNDISGQVEYVIKENKEFTKNKLVLVAGGPTGNIIVHKAWKHNPNNIYLDIGSTLNPWLTGNNRGYLKSPSTKTCVW